MERYLQSDPAPLEKGTPVTADNLADDDMLLDPDQKIPVRFYGRAGRHLFLFHRYKPNPVTGKYVRSMQYTAEEEEVSDLNYVHAGFRYDKKEWDPPNPPYGTTETHWIPVNEAVLIENGWLAPDGTMYPCSYEGHLALCDRLIIYGIVEDVPKAAGGYYANERIVECAGFAKLAWGLGSRSGDAGWMAPVKPGTDVTTYEKWATNEWRGTEAQQEYIERHTEAGQFNLPYWLDREFNPGVLKHPSRTNYPKPRKSLDGD